MDDNKFLKKLSQNLLEILDDDDEYFDVTIETGTDLDTKNFRAHMVILSYRSPSFRKVLTTNKKKNDGTLTKIIKLPNILPETFQVILRFVYGGRISLEEYDASDIVKILIAAGELDLQELVDSLQSFLVKSKASWMEQNFDFIYQISFENGSFLELQNYCADFISKNPDKILKSLNLSLIPEKLLITLIQNHNLNMSDVQVWDYVIKWGLARNPELPSDLNKYSKEYFNDLKSTIENCILFIDFHNLTSKEFSEKVLPYKKILPKELYMNLLKDFLANDYAPILKFEHHEIQEIQEIQENNPEIINSRIISAVIEYSKNIDSEITDSTIIDSKKIINPIIIDPIEDSKIIDSRIIDSKILSNGHVELISRWIDKSDKKDKINFSYEFRLLYRGSRDGLTTKKFHKFCDNKEKTVTIARVEDSKEIFGGYNPIIWKSDRTNGTTKDSFIFSFKHRKNVDDYILSRVINEKDAINNGVNYGPSFGNEDLHLYRSYLRSEMSLYCNYHRRTSYERPIRENSGYIGRVIELEVFQVMTQY